MSLNGTGRFYAGPIELMPDVWIVIMGYLSTPDLVVLGKVIWFIATRRLSKAVCSPCLDLHHAATLLTAPTCLVQCSPET